MTPSVLRTSPPNAPKSAANFGERVTAGQELLDRLDGVPLGRMYQASFQALMRLQLYFTGRTHELLLEFRDKASGALIRSSKNQPLDGGTAFGVQADLLRMWGDTWSTWTAEFQQVRREAAWIAFGVQAVFHERLVATPLSAMQASSQIAESAPLGGGGWKSR